jgi:hypothetical protein
MTDIDSYTLDFGLSRPTCVALPSSVAVWNIISETYLNGTSFLILDHNYTTVMQIDFKTAFDRECTLDDYKEWYPSTPGSKNQDGLTCQMGVQTKYLRRDPSRVCHSMNGYLEEKIRERKACKCTEYDWEWWFIFSRQNFRFEFWMTVVSDYGYVPSGVDDKTGQLVCTRDDTIKLNDPPLWCKPGRKYNVTKGWVFPPKFSRHFLYFLENFLKFLITTENSRNISTLPLRILSRQDFRFKFWIFHSYRLEAGNGCQGGVDHHPQEKDCPDTPVEDADEYVNPNGASHKAGWIAVGIMVPIVLLIVAGAFIALNNEKLREKLPYFGTLFSTNVARDGYSRPGGGAPGEFFSFFLCFFGFFMTFFVLFYRRVHACVFLLRLCRNCCYTCGFATKPIFAALPQN